MSSNLHLNFHRVMVIDDNQIDKYIIKYVVSTKKFSDVILDYDCADKALEYLTENQNNLSMLPQVIFIDINMPGMSGFDFMKVYDKLSYILKNTCKVFITSATNVSDSDLYKLDDKNIVSFLQKPITRNHLEVIQNLVY